jgi:hypothetical protein
MPPVRIEVLTAPLRRTAGARCQPTLYRRETELRLGQLIPRISLAPPISALRTWRKSGKAYGLGSFAGETPPRAVQH